MKAAKTGSIFHPSSFAFILFLPTRRPARRASRRARRPPPRATRARIHTPTARRSIALHSPSRRARPPHDRRSSRPLLVTHSHGSGGAPAAPPYFRTGRRGQVRILFGSVERARSVAQFAQHRRPASRWP